MVEDYTYIKTLSLALALTLVCPNPKIPNPNPLTLIETVNLIKPQQCSETSSVSGHLMNINKLALIGPRHYLASFPGLPRFLFFSLRSV